MKKIKLEPGECIEAIVPQAASKFYPPLLLIHITKSNSVETRIETLGYSHDLKPELIALFKPFCAIYQEVFQLVNSQHYLKIDDEKN